MQGPLLPFKEYSGSNPPTVKDTSVVRSENYVYINGYIAKARHACGDDLLGHVIFSAEYLSIVTKRTQFSVGGGLKVGKVVVSEYAKPTHPFTLQLIKTVVGTSIVK